MIKLSGNFLIALAALLGLGLSYESLAKPPSPEALIPDLSKKEPEPAPPPSKFNITEFKPISVNDASNNIRHVRIKFSQSESRLDPNVAASLANLFDIVDLASLTKAEVTAYIITAGRTGLGYEDHLKRARKMLEMIDRATKPDELVPVYELLRRVVAEQIRFRRGHTIRTSDFRQEGTLPPLFNKEYSAARISENLEEAVTYLLRLYPNECPKNRQSFSDHLKAVDPCHTPGEN
jgi:hypothetical protein